MGRAAKALDARAFRQACRDFALAQVDVQRTDFKRLGVHGDWDNPYLTLSPRYEAEQLRAFAQIIRNGHLYKGYKPVHWCLDCRSALAEAEVEYEERVSPAIDVRFRVVDRADLRRRFGLATELPDLTASVVIWTTTPWTLPANQAVSLHPEYEYSLLRVAGGAGDELLIVATELAERGARTRWSDAYGRARPGSRSRARAPVAPSSVPRSRCARRARRARHARQRHRRRAHRARARPGRLRRRPALRPAGRQPGRRRRPFPAVDAALRARAGLRGQPARGRGARASGATLLQHESYRHSYPVCWRHKSPVIFRATPQWFLGMEQAGLRARALEEIRKVRWTPALGRAAHLEHDRQPAGLVHFAPADLGRAAHAVHARRDR